MEKQVVQHNQFKLWLSFVVRMSLFAVALMWPAGTWRWWEAWVVVVLWTAFAATALAYLSKNDPELLQERKKLVPIEKNQKLWDKVLMGLFVISGFTLYLIPGFDVVRYGWSEALPIWLEIAAMIAHLPCFLLIIWVMKENTYLSQVVKIDKQRGHQVITTGPYAIVRHPMYTAVIPLAFALPVALGSSAGLLPAAALTVLLIVRTYYEDKTLHEELEGYTDYARQTPYRLIPGVW